MDVIRTGGLSEQRVLLQGDSRRRYELSLAHLTLAEYRAIIKHHNARRAQLHSFPLKDLMSFSVTSEPLGAGGGIGSTNQLTMNEGDASNAYNREIYLPVSGTIQIRANGVLKNETTDWTLAYSGATGGRVTWVTSVLGQSLTWTGEFNVPVRYDIGSLPDFELIARMSSTTGVVRGAQSIPMVEIDYLAEWS